MEDEKTKLEKLMEILKNNEIVYTMLVPIINFLYVLIKSYILSFKYNIPIEFIEIDIKIFIVHFIIVFCTFVFSLLIVYILNTIEDNVEKNNKIIVILKKILIIKNLDFVIFKGKFLIAKIRGKIKLIVIFFMFLLFEVLLLLLILANIAYSLTPVTAWVYTIISLIIVIGMNIYFIFFKRSLFVLLIKYIILIVILTNSIPENFKVITYKDKNENEKKVIAMGYRDGEYLALDYDENKGEIYKIPAYLITASEIEEIELRKINDLKPISSRKPSNSLKKVYDKEYIKWEIVPNLILKLVYEETENSVSNESENKK